MRCTTRTCSIVEVLATATSAAGFNSAGLPRRQPPSAVTRTLQSESLMRSASASAENPPNTTECTAPIRAQASIEMGSSGSSGGRSPPGLPCYPQVAEHVGDLCDLVAQRRVGDGARVTRLALPVVGHLVAVAGVDVSVETVLGDVERAADEPAGVGELPLDTVSKGRLQVSRSLAWSAQNASTPREASAYRSRPARSERPRASSGGGNVRSSLRKSSMVAPMGWSGRSWVPPGGPGVREVTVCRTVGGAMRGPADDRCRWSLR